MTTLPQKLQAALDAVRASVFDGECSASLAELARPLGVPGRTMRRRLQRLEDLGYLRIERLPGRSSIYRLTPKGRGLSGLGGILRRLFVQRGKRDRLALSVCRLSCDDITVACRICINKSAVLKAQDGRPVMFRVT
jgi:DNA-binding transcriptional ArsR family regulator